ncbi:MAG: pseudouridylate synthase [Bacteroidota bacterium]|nr:pseudouridylate synthase [Bacteroidota bacterium]
MATSFLENKFFIPFERPIKAQELPARFTYPFEYEPHPLCLLASKELQNYIINQKEWKHNFGLIKGSTGAIIGKMFGVLVVKTKQDEIGYLAAFSGKLAGSYNHSRFVPPIFDSLTKDSFLNVGMNELSRINQEISMLEESNNADNKEKISFLQQLRKNNSIALQDKLFDHYHFLNQDGEEKNLREIFKTTLNTKPPSGAGDCAAPKLLQYAFQNQMIPIAIAEFWWGLSPKSEFWKHGHFYPACREKCEPILSHMLKGIELDKK